VQGDLRCQAPGARVEIRNSKFDSSWRASYFDFRVSRFLPGPQNQRLPHDANSPNCDRKSLYIREGSTGHTPKKDFKNDTIKAGMYMKTNKMLTKCPAKSRTFKFNRHDFCRKERLSTAICHFNLVFHGFCCRKSRGMAKMARPR